jgi:hypothetical protein
VYLIGSHDSILSLCMGIPTSMRHLLFCRWRLSVPGPRAHLFGTSVKIGNVFRPSDALLTSDIRGHML